MPEGVLAFRVVPAKSSYFCVFRNRAWCPIRTVHFAASTSAANPELMLSAICFGVAPDSYCRLFPSGNVISIILWSVFLERCCEAAPIPYNFRAAIIRAKLRKKLDCPQFKRCLLGFLRIILWIQVSSSASSQSRKNESAYVSSLEAAYLASVSFRRSSSRFSSVYES